MVRIFGKHKEQHECKLAEDDDSDAGMPQLDPSAGRCRILMREFCKLGLVSFNHPQTHFYIRSRSGLAAERRHQCRSRFWFVIHPLSAFAFYRCIFMTVAWFILGLGVSFFTSFGDRYLVFWSIFESLFILDIIVNFFHGYIETNTKEMIIDMRLIMRRYLLGYFISDALSMFPIPLCITIVNEWNFGMRYRAAEKCCYACLIQPAFRMFRVLQAIENCNSAIEYLGFSKFFTTIFCIVVKTIFMLNFFTCLIFQIGTHLVYTLEIKNTFMKHSGLLFEMSLYTKYVSCLLHTSCIFFHSSFGIYQLYTILERILNAIVMLVGLFHFVHVIVQVYDVVSVYAAVGNKFDEVERQLNEFMVQKRLPRHLRTRIAIYYHHRFEKKYFRESLILDTLTDHLRYEIILFMCMPLVEKAQFFKGLPRHLTGQLMASFSREVFLHNDVLFKCGDNANKVYFIYSGCVAQYTVEGMEYFHYEDGDNFGEWPLVTGGVRRYVAVSTEITETYTLTYHALRRYLRPYPQLWSKMMRTVQTKHERASAETERLKRGISNIDAAEIKDTLEFM